MKVVVHYPETEEGRKRLAKAVATANFEMLKHRLLNHPCPAWQKEQIIKDLIVSLEEGDSRQLRSNKS